jgi:hypothetical protein
MSEPSIIAILGTILAVGLNLSPIVLFYELFKGKRNLNSIPEMMFIMGVFCSTTNLAYGILKEDKNLYINSAICTIIQIIYALTYLYFYANKQMSKWLLYAFISLNLTSEVLYIFADVIKYHTSKKNEESEESNDFAENFTGWFNVGMTVVNAGAPGQKIFEVWKTGNFMLIPIFTTITQILCSGLWGCYGFIEDDPKLYIPNLIGVVLCGIQIFSYFYFYVKSKGIPPGGQNNEEDNENEEHEEENENENARNNLIEKNDASNSD